MTIAAALSGGACAGEERPPIADEPGAIHAAAPCFPVSLSAAPVGIGHVHAPELQQTVGKVRAWLGRGGARYGVALATITGASPDGALLVNHHFSFEAGLLLTEADRVVLTPTSDPCRLAVTAEVFFVGGTRAYAGLSGQAAGEGEFDVCGAPGLIELTGELCR